MPQLHSTQKVITETDQLRSDLKKYIHNQVLKKK